MLRNFPESDRVPWEVISTFGPTPSGAEGFTAIVPEMNKALIIFKGNYDIEQGLSDDVVDWSYMNLTEGWSCRNCTVNRQAAQAYVEVKEATNDWQEILDAYYNQGLVFSIAGHGFGGMLSQIASVDMNMQGHCWYSHAYGSPRVFNQAGADWYNQRFNGEAGERGVFADDQYSEFIPEGPNYAHAGTSFLYWGRNSSTGNPNMKICWHDEDQTPCLPGAESQQYDTTPEQDHYFYWANVGQCGGTTQPIPTLIQDFIDSHGAQVDSDDTWRTTSAYGSPTSRYNQGGSGGGYYTSSSSSSRYGGGGRYSSSSSSQYRQRPGPTSSSRSYGYPPSSNDDYYTY
ncbi:hypothetical protein P389DRAFT_112839 [Cystobasidium minutum MCA 4210]|uniref:uncharacterized protein n=1 Tax=Cystobasidium minutum MCA 4210 TaxID=1397322 RepID=UPI0034CF26A6|eukprot:jgi/Rhomi1/112839/CE112838_7561